MPGSGSSGEARREPLDAMTQLSQGRVEAAGVTGWHRVGDRPVHRRQRTEFLTGPVAHRDDEVAVLLYPADMPRLLAAQRQVMPPPGGGGGPRPPPPAMRGGAGGGAGRGRPPGGGRPPPRGPPPRDGFRLMPPGPY